MVDLPEFDAKTLCFADAGVERGFLASRRAKLATNVFIGLGLLLAYLLATLISLVFQGWSTGGQVFAPTSEGRLVAERRGLALISLSVLVAVGMLVARTSGMRYGLSPRGLEIFTSCFACLMSMGITLQHPWYLAKLCGVSDPWPHIPDPFELADDKLLLLLDVLLTGIHLMLPIRWVSLWPAEAAVILSYVVPAFALGSASPIERVPINVVLMSLLVFTAAWGKRALESHERVAFAQIAAERTMRAQAEHRLWQAESRQEPAPAPREVDASSLPTTATGMTGDLFDLGDGDTVEEGRLEEIMDLGYQEHWLVKAEALQPLQNRILGAGGFGITMVALYHGSEVVLKAPRSSKDKPKAKALLAAALELRILRRLHHPNIVFFYGAHIDPGTSDIILVLEHIWGQELQEAISGIPTTPPMIADRCTLGDNVCSALRYLHAQVPIVIHGDIKSSNVLVERLSTRRNAKLLDFGLSRLLTRRARDLGGTLKWMAPEVLTKDSSAKAPSADVFSFGRLLYMVMTGRAPLSSASRDDIIKAARRGGCPELDWPEEMPLLQEAQRLCKACLEVDPAMRPSMAAAQQALHRWEASPRIAGNVAMVLREVFPHKTSPGVDLHQALEHVRSMESPVSSAPAAAERGRAGRLALPHLEETPDLSKLMSLAGSMTTWNVRLFESDCCSKHALVRELRRVSLLLQTHPCKPAIFVDEQQCPKCKLLSLVDGICEVCCCDATAVAQAPSQGRSRKQAAIESLSEAPGDALGASGGGSGSGGERGRCRGRDVIGL